MTYITGSHGFIGTHLLKRLGNAKRLSIGEVVHGKLHDDDNLFFLSTYGNMAHHHNHGTMIQANVADLLLVLNLFSAWLCYMSSSSVTLQVQTPYSRTKRAAEEILLALPESQSCIVRPFSVTGIGE